MYTYSRPLLHIGYSPQVYIPKRRTLIQVLPPANVYTKFADILADSQGYGSFLCYFQCFKSKFSVRIGWRKSLYECTPFWYVNL